MLLNLLFSHLGYTQTKTTEVQQRSSSVATQQTTVSSVPSHPSTTGVSTERPMATLINSMHMLYNILV